MLEVAVVSRPSKEAGRESGLCFSTSEDGAGGLTLMSAQEFPVRALVGFRGHLAGMNVGEPVRAPPPTRAIVHVASYITGFVANSGDLAEPYQHRRNGGIAAPQKHWPLARINDVFEVSERKRSRREPIYN